MTVKIFLAGEWRVNIKHLINKKEIVQLPVTMTYNEKNFSGREMGKEMKRLLGLVMVVFFSLAVFTGCGISSDSTDNKLYGEAADINIAVLGSKSQFETRRDFFVGMEIAKSELKEQGINVSYETLDDEESRDNGVAIAKDVAKDDKYTLAFTLQSDKTVDSVAAIFEAEKKPLIIINECYDSTMNSGYNYVLSGVVSAEESGRILAQYCEKNGIKWVAAAHSETQYEKILAQGFDEVATESRSTHLVDSTSGPYRVSDFVGVWERWKTLGVQAVLISFEDIEWASEMVKMVRNQDKDMLILGDAGFNDIRYLESYKDYLEGIVVAGSYSIDSEERLQEFYDKYEDKIEGAIDLDITSVTAQGYDFVNLVVSKVRGSDNVDEFMKNIKSQEGYEGVTGIKFKENGQLDKAPSYWTVKDGQMYRMK